MKEYCVDRIEGEMVILVGEEEVVNLRRVELFEDVAEGDVLLWDGKQYHKEDSLTEERRKKSRRLIDDLFI